VIGLAVTLLAMRSPAYRALSRYYGAPAPAAELRDLPEAGELRPDGA
jgi:hypothetical protein